MIERNFSVLLGVTLCLLLTAAHLQAADVRISWTAPTTNANGTPLTDLAGYKVYRGTSSGNYTNPINVGNTTSYTLTGLTAGQRYYVVVTAYDTSGNESAYSSPPLSFVAPSDAPSPPPPPPPPPPSASVVWAVNAGGSAYQASNGTSYGADGRYSGGSTHRTSQAIAGTTADTLYQSERYGNFSYAVPLTNGDYTVTLRFAEIYFTTAGRRVFNVAIEGQQVISNLDLVAKVGAYTAYDVTLPVSVRDGTLNITFQSVVNNAKVSAIQVATESSTSPPPPPPPPSASVVWAVNAGGSAYQASNGTSYGADGRYSGGSTHRTSQAIAGTTADTLYQSERYGNFSYAVPLTNGDYTVTLRFAEIYFTTAGRRVFNVAIEGQQVISNLDLVAKVGAYTAYDVTLPVSVRDGTLNITFQSVVNNAKVSAIQVSSGSSQVSGSALMSGNTPTTRIGKLIQNLLAHARPRHERDGTTASVAPPDRGVSAPPSIIVESLTAERLETAEVAVDHQWKRVEFKRPFVDPVVIAKALSYQQASPAVVQIRSVDATGFEMRLQSWHDTDETRRPETAGYLVLERGRYTLPDGTTIEADSAEVDRQYDAASLAFSQPFAVTPVVMTAVSSAIGGDAVTGRPSRISQRGFQFHLQPRAFEAPAGATATISYVAWEPSSGALDGFTFEVGTTHDVRRDQFHTLTFSEIFTDAPVFLADIQATRAGHPLNLRWGYKDPVGIEIKIDEAPSSDGVEPIATDTVGYIVIQ